MPTDRLLSSLVASAIVALAIAGCTADTQGETGSLSLQLVINGDTEIDEVDWTITQGEEVVKSGTINTSANGATASVEAYGLEPGEYSILMEAVSTDGETTCKGKAMFSIEVGEVTEVHVMLNCKLPSEFGGVRVEGEFNLCPVLRWADASPMTTSVGNQIDLSAVATDEEGDPITYMWSSGSGMGIADPMAADTTYTCTEVGPDTITILVTDDGGTYCMSMHTFDDINCVPADGDPCEGVICDDTGNECTTAACNPATGVCETSNVADGTDCDGGAGMCTAGDCVPKDLCMDVVCDDDGNECTAEVCNPSTGLCETSDVSDGTPCGDGGACMGGTCIEEDLCMDVVCDDTGNDCTVGVCNSQTGICDPMNVADGTACNDDTGTCVAGVCEVGDLCMDVVCDSGNECVDPGTCNPSNGMCEGGGPEPIDTPCNVDGVCDGAGTCVECNDGTQCPDDGNQCTMASCDSNTCGQSNVMNGQVCDLVGTDDGMCEDGTCVAVPDCTPATASVDCEDGDPCTVHSCPDGMCVTMPEEDGVSCDAAGTPGSCQSGVCVGLCEGVTCPDLGECQDNTCNPANGLCEASNVGDGTACGDGGECMGGVCIESDPVIDVGAGSTANQALPKVATAGTCVYDMATTTCSGCVASGVDAPGGGDCSAFGVQEFQGCEVPGGVLNSQLAIDTTMAIAISSDGAGNITHDVTATALNPALVPAAGLVTVDAFSLFISVTGGSPGLLSNSLDPAFSGQPLGAFTNGTNTLILDNDAATGIGVEVPTVTTAVTPTVPAGGNVVFDYDNFSLTLTIVATGAPLTVDDAGCVFDVVGPGITVGVN